MKITVGPEGDYHTIAEAVEAVPYNEEAVIEIAAGTYHEKLFIEKRNITLAGSGRRRTIIEYDDGANDTMPDGTRRGTFRSQTVFLGGEKCRVTNMTIRNTAGEGDVAGQALAVYADADEVYMENVELSSHQDTLFMAPLPDEERQPNGFFGPRMLTPRKLTKQNYKNCIIRGDVDFIFGGADALFEDCEIIVCDRGQDINGFVTAPGDMKDAGKDTLRDMMDSDAAGTAPGDYSAGVTDPDFPGGFVFRHCVIRGENMDMKGTVYLGRPWRPTGKVSFVECRYGESIHPNRFAGWKDVDVIEPEARFTEISPMDLNGNPI
jgi:pectinesterase